MNRGKSIYLFLLVSLLLLRITDLYITYQITPDLSEEWNPLVSKLGLGWSGLMVTQIILVLVALIAYQRFANRIQCPVDKPGLNIAQFVFYYFNGRDLDTRSWFKCFFKLPSKYYLKVNGAFIGFVVVASFISSSVFAILHNLLVLYGVNAYLDFVYDYNSTYVLFVFVFLVTLSANIFFLLEFRQYRLASNNSSEKINYQE